MLKKDHSNLIILFLLSILVFILLFPTTIITEVTNACLIFITKYFPAVFPLFIITDLLINYNFINKFSRKIGPLFRFLFHIDGPGAFIIIMSMLSGFPSGSKYISDLLDKKLLTKDTANYLITFTHFSNPLFILGTCFLIVNNRPLTIFILISHFLANFIIALITRPKNKLGKENRVPITNTLPFTVSLSNSIYKTFKLLFLILGTSIIFFIISGITTSIIKDNNINFILTGFLELTKGINSIPLYLSPTFKGILILTFISFGSVSVHMQVLSILKDHKISYLNFLLGRISQVAISIIIFLILIVIYGSDYINMIIS